MGKRGEGDVRSVRKIDSFRVGLPLLLILINSRSFFYYTWIVFRHAQLKLSVSSLLNVPMTGTFFAFVFSLSYIQTNSDRRKISKK